MALLTHVVADALPRVKDTVAAEAAALDMDDVAQQGASIAEGKAAPVLPDAVELLLLVALSLLLRGLRLAAATESCQLFLRALIVEHHFQRRLAQSVLPQTTLRSAIKLAMKALLGRAHAGLDATLSGQQFGGDGRRIAGGENGAAHGALRLAGEMANHLGLKIGNHFDKFVLGWGEQENK